MNLNLHSSASICGSSSSCSFVPFVDILPLHLCSSSLCHRISETEWLDFNNECLLAGRIITTQTPGLWSDIIRIGQKLLGQAKTFDADTHVAIVDSADRNYIYEMRAKGLERNPIRDLFLPGKTRRVRLWEPDFEVTARAACLAADWIERQYRKGVEYGWLHVISGGLLAVSGRRQCAQLVLDYTRILAQHSDTPVEPDDFFTPAEIDRYYRKVLEL